MDSLKQDAHAQEQSDETRGDLPTNPWSGRAAERYEHTNRNRLRLPQDKESPADADALEALDQLEAAQDE